MLIPSTEDIGYIVARIAIADENFAKNLLIAAHEAGNKVLPGDVNKIELWLTIMENFRKYLV